VSDFATAAIAAARAALGLLGWPAEIFWQATPADLLLVLEARLGTADVPDVPDVAALKRMMESHADGR
jgi:hypothetical protein